MLQRCSRCTECGQPIDHVDQPVEAAGLTLHGMFLSYDHHRLSRNLRWQSNVIMMRLLMLRGRVSNEAYAMAIEDAGLHWVQSALPVHHLRKVLKLLGSPVTIASIHGWGYELQLRGKSVPAGRIAQT